jgi:hypothetical protein
MPRRYSHEEAAAIMAAVGYEVLGAYPGSGRSWPSRCVKCGREVAPTLKYVSSTTRGCRRCAHPRGVCKVDGCDGLVRGQGYCSVHYFRVLAHGNPETLLRVRAYTPGMVCSVADCEDPVVGRGWCSAHWQRWHRYGDPLAGGKTPTRPTDHEDGTRTCKTCGTRKPIEHFPLDASATRSRKGECKPCWSTKATAWYAVNHQRQLDRHRAYANLNRDRVRQHDRERYRRDKPKRLELVVDAGHRRRAMMRHGRPWDRGISRKSLRKRDGDACCYGGVTLNFAPGNGHTYVPTRATIEHIIPISAWGTHTWDNVALACWQCNVRKNRRLPGEWSPELDGAPPVDAGDGMASQGEEDSSAVRRALLDHPG